MRKTLTDLPPEGPPGFQTYVLRARIMPAVLATLPLIAIGVVALPWLEGAGKVWSVSALGLTTLASLVARRAGNRVQPKLFEAWGGMPTTVRLRYASDSSSDEIHRRHRRVEEILGGALRLPTPDEEHQNPTDADKRYADAMRRIVAKLRHHPEAPMLAMENANYGFARNLMGLRSLTVVSSILCLLLSFGVAGFLIRGGHGVAALLTVLPAVVVAVAALCLLPTINAEFVRPSADAFADRTVEGLDVLPSARSA